MESNNTEKLLRNIIDSSADMIEVFEATRNEQGEIIDFIWILTNKAAGEKYGNVVGKRLLSLNSKTEKSTFFETLKKVAETGETDQRVTTTNHEPFGNWYHQSTVRQGDAIIVTTRDVTPFERAKAEEALHRSEEKYRTLFNSIDEGVMTLQLIFNDTGHVADWVYLEHNPSLTKQTGITNDIIGKRVKDIYPDLESYWFEAYDRVAKTGNPERHEYYFITLDRWFDIYISQVENSNGARLVCVYKNITERKRQEEALRESEEKYRLLYNSIDEGCYQCEVIFDENNKPVDILYLTENAAAIRMLGQSFVGKYLRKISSLYEDYWYQIWGDVALTGISTKQERFSEADHKWFDFFLSKVEGKDRQVVVLFNDITERKRQEEALRKSEEKYRSLFETADEGFCLMELIPNKQGYIDNMVYLETNQSYARLTGAPDVVGKSTNEVLPNLEQQWWDVINRVYQTGLAERIENEAVDFSRWFSVHFSRVGQKDNKRLALIFDNITDRKRREQQQAFLLKLGDTLRAFSDADSIATMAVKLLANELHLDRCYIVARRQDGDIWDIGAEFRVPALPPMPPVLDQKDFPGSLRIITEETLVFNNTNELPGLTEMEKKGLQALGFGGLVMGVLRRGEKNPYWAMVAASIEPRQWTTGEVALVQEVGERIWGAVERAKSEDKLRKSEEYLRQATEAADIYSWEFDFKTQVNILSENTELVIGRKPYDTFEENLLLTHPDDREIAAKAFEVALNNGTDLFNYTVRSIAVPEDVKWINVSGKILRDTNGTPVTAIGISQNITQRKLQDQRRDFLLKFNDIINPIKDPEEICLQACRFLGEYLHADRILYCSIEDQGTAAVMRGFHAPGVLDFSGRRKISDYSQNPFNEQKKGVVIVNDTKTETRISEEERKNNIAAKIGAYIGVPLIKNGEVIIILAVHQQTSRTWTEAEIALSQEMAERIWAAIEKATTEEALRKSEEKYRSLFETIDEGYCVVEVILDDNGAPVDELFLEMNPAYEKHTGLTKDIIGKRSSEIVPNREPEWGRFFGNVALTGKADYVEYHVNGIDRWLSTHASRIGGEGSLKVAMVFSDITERKRREAHLAFLADISEDFSQISGADDIMQTVGAKLGAYLKITTCNFSDVDEASDRVTVHSGGSDASVPGTVDTFRLSEYLNDGFIRASRAGETVIVRDTQNDPRTDAARYAALNMYSSVTVPFHNQGRWIHYIAVGNSEVRDWRADEVQLIREVSDRVFPRLERARADEALRDSEQQLKRLLKLRDEFIGIASHELNTPITSMKIYAEIVQERIEEIGDKADIDLLTKLNVQIDRLSSLIGALLDTTRIAEGRLKLDITEVDIAELVRERADEVGRKSNHKIQLQMQLLPEVVADRERIGQVITNLLTNAIKYSPDGTVITVSTELEQSTIKVSVRDQGFGIPEDDVPKVFERFFRVTANKMDSYPGMGLGLYISAQIIEMHGGTISVRSKLDIGSTFSFTIPLKTINH